MTRQYKRVCKLTLGGSGGSLDVSNFRIRFQVTHAELLVPQHADIVVYNLADSTVQKVVKKEYQKITLSAGYEDTYGEVFVGEIIQARDYRENPVDTALAILATDKEQAHNYAVVSKTLPAGSTYKDQVDECLKALKPFGVTPGFIPDLGNVKMPKNRVLHGMVKDVLRQIGQATNTAPSIQSGKLQMVKNDGYKPGEAVVLNSRTGLIGRPEQTIDGIIVRMLLNPKVRPGTRLKIDQKSINQAAFSPAYTGEVNNSMIPSLATDGMYKVIYVDEIGDTRGPPWYTVATCINAAGDGPIPLSLAPRGITIPQ